MGDEVRLILFREAYVVTNRSIDFPTTQGFIKGEIDPGPNFKAFQILKFSKIFFENFSKIFPQIFSRNFPKTRKKRPKKFEFFWKIKYNISMKSKERLKKNLNGFGTDSLLPKAARRPHSERAEYK